MSALPSSPGQALPQVLAWSSLCLYPSVLLLQGPQSHWIRATAGTTLQMPSLCEGPTCRQATEALGPGCHRPGAAADCCGVRRP